MYSNQLLVEDVSTLHRNLLSTSSSVENTDSDGNNNGGLNDITSGIAIAWFAIILIVTMSLVVVCCYAQRRKRRQQQQQQQQNHHEQQWSSSPGDVTSSPTEETAEEDLEIARIQANVKVFVEKEMVIKNRNLIRKMKDQLMIVTAQDCNDSSCQIDSKTENKQSNNSSRNFDFQDGCSICMEAFSIGDVVAHSGGGGALSGRNNDKQSPNCNHLFHQKCLMQWFLASSSHEQKCPCCRQLFIRSSTTQSNIVSMTHDHAAINVDEEEEEISV